jgi:hypothetical protein
MFSGVYPQMGCINVITGGTLPSGTKSSDYILFVSGDSFSIAYGAGLRGTDMGTNEWSLSASILFIT